MVEKLHAVIRPHPPLPFPNLRDQNRLEVNPIRIDAIIHAVVWLDPVSVHITWIELLGTRAPGDEDVLNATRPERCHRASQSRQKPTAPRSEPEPTSDFFQRRPMVARRQCIGGGIESPYHATFIMAGTNKNINTKAVILSRPRLRFSQVWREVLRFTRSCTSRQ
jgi:hypothetical protein